MLLADNAYWISHFLLYSLYSIHNISSIFCYLTIHLKHKLLVINYSIININIQTKYLNKIIFPFPDEIQAIWPKTFPRASCISTCVEDKAVFKTYWQTSSNFILSSFNNNTLFLYYKINL